MAAKSRRPMATTPANGRARKRPAQPATGASRRSGNNRRPGRARGRAPACPPAPASRARFPPRASPRPRRPSATICRSGPARRCRPPRRTGAARRSATPLRSSAGPRPPRPRATGAASQRIVTCGSSCARSQSQRSRSPASNWRWLTWPRANSQPSGLSARLTVPTAPDALALRVLAARRSRRPPARPVTCLRSPVPTRPCLLSCPISRCLPHRRICRTEEKPYWFVYGGRGVMITRIREVRRARGMTLDDVARACAPPTTPQTIGRLETGHPHRFGRLAQPHRRRAGGRGRRPRRPSRPRRACRSSPSSAPTARPRPSEPRWSSRRGSPPGQIAMTVSASIGDYRAGDEIWCERLEPEELRPRAQPRRAGPPPRRPLPVRPPDRPRRTAKLHLLPPGAGGRQSVVADPPWAAMAVRLVRAL